MGGLKYAVTVSLQRSDLARRLRAELQPLRAAIRLLTKGYGVRPRSCPGCGYQGRFRCYGNPPRYDALCPNCGSLERHRLLTLVLQRHGLIRPGDHVLHFAPEAAIARQIREIGVDYQSADIEPGRADRVLNIENIALPDAVLDVVVANHILEHVDDRRAVAEMARVLKPGGRLIVMTPVVEGWDESYERPDISDPAERFAHFGQSDHIRIFGRDIRNRLTSAGFALSEYGVVGDDVVRYALPRGARVFVCTKPQR